jgi:autotransporter-associated beta strand protein
VLYINNNNALGTGVLTWANGSAGNTSGAAVTFANNINLTQNTFRWTTGVGETTGVFSINNAASISVTGGRLTLRKLDANISGRAVELRDGGGTIHVKESAGANVTGAVSIGSASAITVILGHQNALGTGTMSWLSGASTFQASTDLTGANAITNQLSFASASGGSGYTFSGNNSIEFTGTATVNNTNDNQMILNNIAAGKTLKFTNFVLNNAATASMTTVFSGSGATEVAGTISNGGGTTRNLTYNGTGSLTLSGSNSYNGLTTFTGRTLTLAGSNSSAGTLTINGGNGGLLPTVLQLNSASNGGLASGLLTLTTGRIEALNAGRTLSNNVLLNTTTSVAGVFQGAQDITINGTVTGNTGGDRTLGNTLASGKKLTLGAVNITNDVSATARTLTLGGTGDTVITGVVANGAGTGVNRLTIWGGNVTLTQANTYTGATTLSAGTLVLDFSAAGAPTNNIINSGNSLVMSAGGLTLKGAGGAATNSQSVVMTNATGLSRIVVNNNGSTGTTTLALTSTGLGSRGANGATMNIDLSQGLGGNANGNAITTTATAATLGWATVTDASGTGFARYNGTNVVRLTGQTTLLATSNASPTDFITAPGGTSTSGSPYLSLTAATPSYNTLTIDTSSASGANFLDLNGKTVTLGNRGVLLTGSNDFTIQGTGQLGAANSEVIVQQMGSGNMTINSAIGSGSTTLTKSGPGTLTVGGTQTYTGLTTVNQGTLVLNADISTAGNMAINEGTVRLGASDRISNGNAMTMKSGGTLDLNGFNETITSLAMDAGATINGGNTSTLTLSGATPITLNSGAGTGVTSVINANLNFSAATATLNPRQNAYGAATTLEINGAISGASTAILGSGSNAGAATLRLSGTTANTFSGSFGVQFGTNGLVEFNKTAGVDAIGTGGINVSTANAAPNYKWLASNQINDSAPIIMEGGTLNLNGFNETVASFTSGVTGGANSFVNSTEGTLTLAGSTGNVLILSNNAANTSKTLDMNLALSGSGGNISLAPGASTGSGRVIQIGGTTPGARTLDLGSVVRIIDVADGAQAVDALITSQITGTGGINKTGAGVLQLTAANTFSGDTKVSAGTLTLGNNTQPLQNSALDTSGAGVVNITGLNALTLGGLKGSTNLTSVITTGYVGSLYSLTLNSGTGVTNTYSGVISDGAELSLTKTGLGTQVLSGTNTYSGTTTISNGALQIGSAGVGKTGTGAVTAQTGGTILGTGVVQGTSFTAQSGSTVQAGDGTAQSNYGTLTFTPASGSGSFDFQSGSSAVLGLNPGGTGDLLSFDGLSNGTLLFNGNLSVTAPGYNPVGVDTFNLLDWANLSTTTFHSRFSSASYSGFLLGNGDDNLGFNLPDISSSGYGWDISQFIVNGTISTVLVIPEPSRAVLLMFGLVGLVTRRRRK